MFQSDIGDNGNLGDGDDVGGIVESSKTDFPYNDIDLLACEVHDCHGREDFKDRDRIIFGDAANRIPHDIEHVEEVPGREHGAIDRDAFADIHE